jgi:hypothetical protein
MRRTTLVAGLAFLGLATWFSSRLVDSQPTLALAVVFAVLLFSAGAVAATNGN